MLKPRRTSTTTNSNAGAATQRQSTNTNAQAQPSTSGAASGRGTGDPNAQGRASLITMECTTCERSQRKFYCANCVSSNIHEYRASQTRIENERHALAERVQGLLDQLEPRRTERALRAALIDRTREVKREAEKVRKQSAEIKEKVRLARSQLQYRRDNLVRAERLVSEPLTFTHLTAAQARLDGLAERLALARRGLALLLMQAFDLRQNGQGEARICGLSFPFPGDHRHFRPDHINGVLTHTLHFLNLLVYYLGIKLPFQVSWSGSRALVGKPTIRAGAGNAEDGDWVRWTVKQPLYVSPSDTARSGSALAAPSSFTTALSMLAFNVLYLLQAQGLPLSKGPDGGTALPPRVLNELIRLCIFEGLGRRSHATRPHLLPPTHGFTLEFAKVLEAAKEADGSKRAEEMRARDDGDGDWDLVDESS